MQPSHYRDIIFKYTTVVVSDRVTMQSQLLSKSFTNPTFIKTANLLVESYMLYMNSPCRVIECFGLLAYHETPSASSHVRALIT